MTVEMKNGEIYRGHLNEAEDTMNCFMTGGKNEKTREISSSFCAGVFFLLFSSCHEHSSVHVPSSFIVVANICA